jgi:hypothetical protein
LDHLLERFREGRISVDDFTELKHWLESEPEVPAGMWFKWFRKFTLAGEGEFPKTFLGAGNASDGRRSKVGINYGFCLRSGTGATN